MTTSINKFTQEEYSALANYNPHTHYIIINHQAAEGVSPIEIVAKDSITCWQKILRFFDRGDFAHKTIHIVEVAQFLANEKVEQSVIDQQKDDWSGRCVRAESIQGSNDTNAYKAYHRLCCLAEKAHKKGCDVLLEKMSVTATFKHPDQEEFEFLLNPEHTYGLSEGQIQQYLSSLQKSGQPA